VPGIDRDGLPREGGTYALVLHVGAPVSAQVGKLGLLEFAPGYYVYVGRARSGLRARIQRHLRTEDKRLHWHVDYLRQYAQPVAALTWQGVAADECAVSDKVAGLAQRSVPGFGCSDCRCRSHLHYFQKDPTGRLRRIGAHLAWECQHGA